MVKRTPILATTRHKTDSLKYCSRIALLLPLMVIPAVAAFAADPPGTATPQDTASPAKKPTKPTAPELAESNVVVRFGLHDSYNRLVLHWPDAVRATATVKNGIATISFDRKARIDATQMAEILPDALKSARLRPDGMALTFPVPAGRSLHCHTRNGLVIIDLVKAGMAPPEADTPAAQAKSAAEPSTSAAEPAGTPPAPHPRIKPGPAPIAAPTAQAMVAPIATERAPAAPPQAVAPAPSDTQISLAPLPDPVLLADTPNHQLRVRGTPIDDGWSLRFEWSGPTKASVFVLKNVGWIVFDKPVTLLIQPVSADEKSPNLVQISNPSATLLRVPMPRNARLIVGRAGNNWLVDIRRRNPNEAETQSGPSINFKAGLFPVASPGRPVTLADPDTGEVLLAVPVDVPGSHFNGNEDHGTYHVLPTSQGLLFRPESDTMRLGITEEGVRVTASPAGVTVDRN
jgi:hypothetical protein